MIYIVTRECERSGVERSGAERSYFLSEDPTPLTQHALHHSLNPKKTNLLVQESVEKAKQ